LKALEQRKTSSAGARQRRGLRIFCTGGAASPASVCRSVGGSDTVRDPKLTARTSLGPARAGAR
jgi:hypothetical protein